MLNIVLIEPEIPSNTGNISRTCAVAGMKLHLVGPLGFDISDKAVKRAGLDYWPRLQLQIYESEAEFWEKNRGCRFWLATTKAPGVYTAPRYADGDFLVFGKETRGLREELLRENLDRCIRIPMRSDIRSLNLSNSVAIVAYEALRQLSFPGMEPESGYFDKI